MRHRKQIGWIRATGVAVAVLLLPGVASAATQIPQQEFPEPVFDALKTAFGAYEKVRVDLAGDRLEALPESASELGRLLRVALEDEPDLAPGIPSVIVEAALTTESLAAAKDLASARVTFGEVSRLLMTLAGGDPRLVEGWEVFACPMVESYPKWMQPEGELENPYMGPAMPKCGFASDWAVPVPRSAEEAVASTPSGPEPEFEPGIPGLKMVDVRDHKFLWREIDELQIWERGDRITVAEYRSKAIEKTTHFLELEGAVADEFVAAAAVAVDSVRQSFFDRRQAGNGETSGLEIDFASKVQSAADRLTSLLEGEPRHQLFAPGAKKWLLKLAFGPKESKEARESKEAKGAGKA